MSAFQSFTFLHPHQVLWGFPGGSDDKEFACNAGDVFSPWVGKIPWRREWLPTPVFLPGEFHGQRNLAGYSPWGRKESDMTERLTYTHTHTHTHTLPPLVSASLDSSFPLYNTVKSHTFKSSHCKLSKM